MTKCHECNDTGERDSGGTYPWGEPVYLPCDCKDAKAAAARKNASKPRGKPRGKWVTGIAYELAGIHKAFSFGLVMVAGKAPKDDAALHDWVCQQLQQHGTGINKDCRFEFLELVVTSRLF